jgi:hypothetical protein
MAMPHEIDSLINALHEEREGLRTFAVEKLVSIGREAVPALINALRATSEQTQEAAAGALCKMGSVAVPELRDAMQSDNRQVAWSACWVLGSMSPDVRNARLRLPALEEATELVVVPSEVIAGRSAMRREKFGSYVADARRTRSITVRQRQMHRVSKQRTALREIQAKFVA